MSKSSHAPEKTSAIDKALRGLLALIPDETPGKYAAECAMIEAVETADAERERNGKPQGVGA